MADQPRQLTAPPHAAAHLLQYHDLIESIVSALDARATPTALQRWFLCLQPRWGWGRTRPRSSI